MLQKALLRHIGTVDRIDVATWTDVYAYIFALLCREEIEHAIIEFYKMRQQIPGWSKGCVGHSAVLGGLP